MTVWAIVPLKIVTSSKQRLSGVLSGEQRIRLTLAMAEDVLNTLQKCRSIDQVVLVSGDSVAGQLCSSSGADWLQPDVQKGLNSDLTFACDYAHSKGATHCLILHADLPLLRSDDIDRLIGTAQRKITQSNTKTFAIVPCKQGTGSNLVFTPLPLPVKLVYGQDSYRRFQEEATNKALVCHDLSLHNGDLDVDIPADLDALQRRIDAADPATAKATRRTLARLNQPQTD